nr:hypothetical protein [Oryza sativa Japonica Group]
MAMHIPTGACVSEEKEHPREFSRFGYHVLMGGRCTINLAKPSLRGMQGGDKTTATVNTVTRKKTPASAPSTMGSNDGDHWPCTETATAGPESLRRRQRLRIQPREVEGSGGAEEMPEERREMVTGGVEEAHPASRGGQEWRWTAVALAATKQEP